MIRRLLRMIMNPNVSIVGWIFLMNSSTQWRHDLRFHEKISMHYSPLHNPNVLSMWKRQSVGLVRRHHWPNRKWLYRWALSWRLGQDRLQIWDPLDSHAVHSPGCQMSMLAPKIRVDYRYYQWPRNEKWKNYNYCEIDRDISRARIWPINELIDVENSNYRWIFNWFYQRFFVFISVACNGPSLAFTPTWINSIIITRR